MNKRITKKKETFRIKDIKAMTFKKGETIVVNIERDKISAQKANSFMQAVVKQFPDNKILALIDGMTIREYREKYDN